jgi:hypothetical protein
LLVGRGTRLSTLTFQRLLIPSAHLARGADHRGRAQAASDIIRGIFKAIELDATTRRRTGRELALDVETRQAALAALLRHLNACEDEVRVDPTRTLVQVEQQLWTIVAARQTTLDQTSSALRRAGAKHKRVR